MIVLFNTRIWREISCEWQQFLRQINLQLWIDIIKQCTPLPFYSNFVTRSAYLIKFQRAYIVLFRVKNLYHKRSWVGNFQSHALPTYSVFAKWIIGTYLVAMHAHYYLLVVSSICWVSLISIGKTFFQWKPENQLTLAGLVVGVVGTIIIPLVLHLYNH